MTESDGSVRPRVFISHSAHEPETRERLQQIVEALKELGFHPIVDYERLRNGEDWWDEMSAEIRSAHAVLVLVSPSALTSTPVLRETVVALEDRVDNRGLNRLFVLRMGVRAAEIRKSQLGRAGLHDVHADALPSAEAVRAVLSRILADIDAYRDNSSEELEGRLRTQLQRLHPTSLATAARVLGLDPDSVRGAALINNLARRLLNFDGPPLDCVRLVQRYLEKAPPPAEDAELLVDLLIASAALPESVREDITRVLAHPDRKAVGIAVSQAQTGLLYLRRACTQWLPWYAYSAGSVSSEAHLERLLGDVRAQLVERLGYLDENPNDSELAAELDAYEKASGPIAVLVAAPPDPRLLRQLQGRFPTLLFLFVAGNDHPANPMPGMVWVPPPLPPDDERRLLRIRNQLRIRHNLIATG
ncbi:toll/interleukin-1 receptor domain-containing protein [Amycolatopsis sp. cmx-4-68]|uniref:toll/interleukin-1 receptor domain-containing protein n=1 Tax=Amycolatopsis sp. cmx-4-68 TaxID=2790938 RepID=UPI003978CCD5